MKKHLLLLSAAVAMSAPANAATLISASVTGPTGTVWNTTLDSFYTLFLQTPGLGDYINPNDQPVNRPVTSGANRYLLAGEGYPAGTNLDSDPYYNLTLNFSDGAVLTGQYTPTTNTFLGGASTTVGRTTYSLAEFSYRRFLGDAVQPYRAMPGGNSSDYVGNFHFTATGGVPEPAAWALMISGFGLVGGALRRRSALSLHNA